MKKILVLLTLFAIIAPNSSEAGKVFVTDYENQADFTAITVKYANEANCKVYRVPYENQAGPGKWFYVKYENQADTKIHWVKYANQAKLKVFFVKYENEANCWL